MRSATLALALTLVHTPAWGSALDDAVGRTEVRIRSEAFPVVPGGTVQGYHLADRLERVGYERVHERPTAPGQFFWGTDTFWVFRRAHRSAGTAHEAALIGFDLGPDGVVLGAHDADGQALAIDEARLEPEVIAEAVDGVRAPRVMIELSDLPEVAWRPVLALEDTRYFDHIGIDGIAIARALLEDVRAGEVTQGGSTITQQLVKNRDLTPERTLDRKASEAVRALALEAEYSKEEILGCYLNTVYYGHVDGVGVYGIGTAARVYFGKDASDLTLAEGALLAAMLQGPNAISPLKNPERAKERRDYALTRMEELGWASPQDVARAKATPAAVHPTAAGPERPVAPWFRDHVVAEVREANGARLDKGLGFVAETTLDPLLQAHAEEVVGDGLRDLRRRNPSLAHGGLQAALVALDADTGAVLAYVGGDPADPDGLDRATALRQPGSTVKPLVLLEAFEDCGLRAPLTPATLVSDDPIEVNAPGGVWSPADDDGENHGDVSIRTALVHSYNLPMVRVARYCGFDATAGRLRAAGLDLPTPAPPSFSLGAVETTPLALAGAYTPFANAGRVATPWSVARIEQPHGRLIERDKPHETRVASEATAWLVRDLLGDVVIDGTGKKAAVDGLEVVGKTGSTAADAWFAGQAGGLVVVVWVGRDDGQKLGLSGGSAAAPMFADFVEEAVSARPPYAVRVPDSIVERRVDPETGRLAASPLHDGETEVFRLGALPARDPLLGGRAPAVIH